MQNGEGQNLVYRSKSPIRHVRNRSDLRDPDMAAPKDENQGTLPSEQQQKQSEKKQKQTVLSISTNKMAA